MSVLHSPKEVDRTSISNDAKATGTITSTQLGESRYRNIDIWCRDLLFQRLAKIRTGRLQIVDHLGSTCFGNDDGDLRGKVIVWNPRFYRAIVLGGGLGAAESFLQGDWATRDLTTTLRVLARNSHALTGLEKGAAQLLRPLRFLGHWMQRNSRAGSKRNIASHYDLSNEFFSLMLDSTMTYSSGYFLSSDASLQDASIEKYDRICQRLELKAGDSVLEIGTGWGGFAEHAVKNYGCHVTTTTISARQYEYARERFHQTGCENQITLLKEDYRDLSGKFDKLVSIEMIEAVGEKFLQGYFAQCCKLLKRNGSMLLQAITIPDNRFARYRKSVDFIQRYIFPGGFVPSNSAISNAIGKATDFRLLYQEDFGKHYAKTLSCWRENFCNNLAKIRSLGFDSRFERMWLYYLAYCEAGFLENQIGVSQIHLARPQFQCCGS